MLQLEHTRQVVALLQLQRHLAAMAMQLQACYPLEVTVAMPAVDLSHRSFYPLKLAIQLKFLLVNKL